ncbi:hypothetical protein BDR03DRAFT_963147 [Suillus americanus]|nr:hypothetical protein BDR03DRAFT_963147 [Suillus americanus]
MGAFRAWYLFVILPVLLKFKPVRAVVSSTNAPANPAAPTSKPKPTKSHLFNEMRLDLRVVRYSMLMDFLSHALVVIAPLPSRDASSVWWSQFMFVGATSLSSIGAGVMPDMQCLALCTLQGRVLATKEGVVRTGEAQEHDNDVELEPGKLFGALAVLQAVGQTIPGPMIFGAIYSSTVASFPKAIFATASDLALLSIVFTPLVRPNVSLRNETQEGRSQRQNYRSSSWREAKTQISGAGPWSVAGEQGSQAWLCAITEMLEMLQYMFFIFDQFILNSWYIASRVY